MCLTKYVSIMFRFLLLGRLRGKRGHVKDLQEDKTLARCPPASWKSFGLYIGGSGLRRKVVRNRRHRESILWVHGVGFPKGPWERGSVTSSLWCVWDFTGFKTGSLMFGGHPLPSRSPWLPRDWLGALSEEGVLLGWVCGVCGVGGDGLYFQKGEEQAEGWGGWGPGGLLA